MMDWDGIHSNDSTHPQFPHIVFLLLLACALRAIANQTSNIFLVSGDVTENRVAIPIL